MTNPTFPTHKLPQYFVKVGAKYFDYFDGHFGFVDRLPYGHHSAKEALRAYNYAVDMGSGPARVVNISIVESAPIAIDDLIVASAEDYKTSINKKLSKEELDWLRSHTDKV